MSKKKTHIEYVTHKEYVNTKQGICVSVLTFRIKLDNLPEYDNVLWNFESFRRYINTLDYRTVDETGNIDEYVYWTVKGKSVCSKNDTFDEELGKHIALTRAQENAFKIAGRFYLKIFYVIADNLLSVYDTLFANCFCSSRKESEHIYKLTHTENHSDESKETQTIN